MFAMPARKMSSVALRPLSGISTTRWLSTTVPTDVLCVSTRFASACTVTCSFTEPTFNAASSVRFASTCNTMPVCTYLVKPAFVTSSMYGPIGRLVRVYAPSGPLVAVRAAPVPVCVAFTSAPGTARPVASFTVPLICAVPCAQTDGSGKAR